MKTLFLILNLFLYPAFQHTEKIDFNVQNSFAETIFKTPCPEPNDRNKEIVENFLTKSNWATERQETGAGILSPSQISVLTDSNDSSVRASFNTTHQESLEEENGNGEPAYNVTYYKAGSFYFVVITMRQSDDPNIIGFGLNFIVIYNQNLDLIKGYAF
jgi:hypothetical protein